MPDCKKCSRSHVSDTHTSRLQFHPCDLFLSRDFHPVPSSPKLLIQTIAHYHMKDVPRSIANSFRVDSTNSFFSICCRGIISQVLNAYPPYAVAKFNADSQIDSFAETYFGSWVGFLGLGGSHAHPYIYTRACLINPVCILFIVAIIFVSKCALKACFPSNLCSKV